MHARTHTVHAAAATYAGSDCNPHTPTHMPTLAWVLEMTTHGTAMAAVVLETEHTHTSHSCNRRRLLRRFRSSCAEGAASLVPELEEVGVEGGSSCFFRMAAYI